MALLHLTVKPRSHSDEIVGMDEAGFLHLKVRAIPDKGEANKAVIKLVASYLSIPKTSIEIIRGHTSSKKTLEISSMSQDELDKKLYH